jgi:hypothetical protein
MARKSVSKKSVQQRSSQSQLAFPYCNAPGSLRTFLKLIPQKPKPAKINDDLLRSWGLAGTSNSGAHVSGNINSIIRVLKAIGLVNANDNSPTLDYEAFMTPKKGPAFLAARIRTIYAPLFEASHNPNKEADETLRNLFNIHAGGSESVLRFQIQTFKALCDFADFSQTIDSSTAQAPPLTGESNSRQSQTNTPGPLPIHIDLHIHLPEGKSRRDYEYMFEDIARYIFGRSVKPNE